METIFISILVKLELGTNTPSFKLETTEDASFNGVRVGRGSGNQQYNTTVGNNTLTNNTSGNTNTAIGSGSLNKNTTGSGNTAIGFSSLPENTSGSYNTAIG
jgi:trimeric autotransporter adhesin